jgi:hypothetical protein
MSSLKSFLPWIADAAEISVDSLYERQRELVRHGLLPVRSGRGPGSGVPLTADTLAIFLIGLLSTDNLKEVGPRTLQLCGARPLALRPKGSRKTISTFQADVANSLLGFSIAGYKVESEGQHLYLGIQVTRHWRGTILEVQEVGTSEVEKIDGMQGVEYLVSEEARLISPMISITASIEQESFWFLCNRLRNALSEDEPARERRS